MRWILPRAAGTFWRLLYAVPWRSLQSAGRTSALTPVRPNTRRRSRGHNHSERGEGAFCRRHTLTPNVIDGIGYSARQSCTPLWPRADVCIVLGRARARGACWTRFESCTLIIGASQVPPPSKRERPLLQKVRETASYDAMQVSRLPLAVRAPRLELQWIRGTD